MSDVLYMVVSRITKKQDRFKKGTRGQTMTVIKRLNLDAACGPP